MFSTQNDELNPIEYNAKKHERNVSPETFLSRFINP